MCHDISVNLSLGCLALNAGFHIVLVFAVVFIGVVVTAVFFVVVVVIFIAIVIFPLFSKQKHETNISPISRYTCLLCFIIVYCRFLSTAFRYLVIGRHFHLSF